MRGAPRSSARASDYAQAGLSESKRGTVSLPPSLAGSHADNGVLTLSLHTADPAEARRRARRPAVRWDDIAMIEGQEMRRVNLPAA